MPTDLVGRLHQDKVFVSERSGALRISPHVWANDDDLTRCIAALRAACQGVI